MALGAPEVIDRWKMHVETWRECQECPLCAQRNKIVLARGVVPCDVLFLGEAPGISEDILGQPFVGPAGQKLDEIIISVRASTSVNFNDAYTNLVCCFPAEAKKSDNHQPTDEEIKSCSPRLQEFIELASPKLIVCVGRLASEWGSIVAGKSDVQWCDILHPSAILRLPRAQQDMAVRKCVVIIRDAVERALNNCIESSHVCDDDIPF